VSAVAAPPLSPYKGLTPFEDNHVDALLFFGREREAKVIAANLLATRLTVLYGVSGVGKTSLLRAGVAHRLRNDGLDLVVLSSWAGDAATEVSDAIGDGSERIVVLDQFEEYFLYHRGDAALGEVVADALRDGRTTFLLSLREDSLARLDAFKGRIPNLFGNYLRLDRLDRSAGRDAVVGPVGRWNTLVDADARATLEPELVEEVLDQVETGKLGDGVVSVETLADARIEAPYLQLVLQRVWDEERRNGSTTLRLATLHELGGASQIVREHLERALGRLTPEQKDVAARVFRHLVTPSGAKIAHDVADLADYAAVREGDLAPVLAALGHERILRPVGGDGTSAERYEIFHDVLGTAVLEWRGRRELERERTSARRRHRRLIRIIGACLLALAAMTAVAAYALSQRSEARTQAAHARSQGAIAQAAAKRAKAEEVNAKHAAHVAQVAKVKAKREAHRANVQRGYAKGAARRAKLQAQAAQTEKQKAENQKAIADSARASATANALAAARNAADAKAQARAAAVAAARANKASARARANARRARGHAFAARAEVLLGIDPLRSLANALQAAPILPAQRVVPILRTAIARTRVRAILRGSGGPVLSASFSPDDRYALVATRRGVRLYTVGGRLVRTFRRAPGAVAGAAFLGDGRSVVVAGGDSNARVFRLNGTLLGMLPHGGAVQGVLSLPRVNRLLTWSADGAIHVWASDGSPLATVTVPGRVLNAALSPNAATLLVLYVDTADGRRHGRLFDADSGTLLRLLTTADGSLARGVTRGSFSPDSRLVAVASTDRNTRIWNARTGEVVHTLPADEQVVDVAFSDDGKSLASVSRNGPSWLWNVATGDRRYQLPSPLVGPDRVLFMPGRDFILTANGDWSVRVFEPGFEAATLRGHHQEVTDIALNSAGTRVISASKDGTARIWDPGTTDTLTVIGKHDGAVLSSALSPDGRLAASAGVDNTARVWDIRTHKPLLVLRHDGRVNDVEFSRDGRFLVTASADKTARVWNAASGAPVRTFADDRGVFQGEFSRSGRLVLTTAAVGTPTGVARIWNVSGGSPIVLAHAGIRDAAFSPGDRYVATAGDDGKARLWLASTGALVRTLTGHTDAIVRLSFSPNGRYLATASSDGTVRLWSLGSHGRDRVLNVTEGALKADGTLVGVTSVRFSRNGRFVVEATEDGDASVWRTATGIRKWLLRGHLRAVSDASFSPDGRWVLTTGRVTAGLWSMNDGHLFAPTGLTGDPFLLGHEATLTGAHFGPDGKRILTSSMDGTVRTYFCALCGGRRDLVRIGRALQASIRR
jgi:WD40 repeat protein